MLPRKTCVLSVTAIKPPQVSAEADLLGWWSTHRSSLPQDQVEHLLKAAHLLQTSHTPVAFPTETVYGLGADATRSEAVRGIYEAKQRPSDNPLIVHVGSLDQLRQLLKPRRESGSTSHQSSNQERLSRDLSSPNHITNGAPFPNHDDPIPSIYLPLISRFWPGPLTLLFPLPSPSPFSPLVHPSPLTSVGVRMPSSPLARLLVCLSRRPLAAPSANASTRPSPTTAAHVLEDLDGRIDVVLDGGPCEVGVESTVVDGLASPPVILRPGGVGAEEIRAVGGIWKDIRIGYHQEGRRLEINGTRREHTSTRKAEPNELLTDAVAADTEQEPTPGPRAPGMKYRHYAPRAPVYLFEDDGSPSPSTQDKARAKVTNLYCSHSPSPKPSHNQPHQQPRRRTGIITTQHWTQTLGFPLLTTTATATNPHPQPHLPIQPPAPTPYTSASTSNKDEKSSSVTHAPKPHQGQQDVVVVSTVSIPLPHEVHSISLGPAIADVARGLFSALRELDGRCCEVILVEGVRDVEGQGEEEAGGGGGERRLAAAVMDRVRKAASSAESF